MYVTKRKLMLVRLEHFVFKLYFLTYFVLNFSVMDLSVQLSITYGSTVDK